MDVNQTNPDLPITWASFDDNYVWPWMVMTYSAVRNCSSPFHMGIANCNGLISPPKLELVNEFCTALSMSYSIRDIDIRLDVKFNHQFNITVYSRVVLLDIEEREFVWLDSDLLLFPGWSDIFVENGDKPDMADVVAFAVVDRDLTLAELAKSNNQAFAKAGARYFNTGLMKLRPLVWKQLGLDKQWSAAASDYQQLGFIYPDQDVLNYLLVNNTSLVPGKYNHIVSEASDRSEVIRHYAGFPKPWRLNDKTKEYYLSLEVLNQFDPANQPSGGGIGWTFFEEYWQYERELMSILADKSEQLASSAKELRRAVEYPMSSRDAVKYRLLKMLAKRIL